MKVIIRERGSQAVIAEGEKNQDLQEFEGNLYFKPEAVQLDKLRITERTYTCPYKGTCFWIDLETEHGRAQNIGWVYRTPKPGYEFIRDQIGFYRSTSGTIAEEVTA
ncbi:DUF427 domain-containing protein [Anaerolineae bacterium CFX9]|nr:DUF427 domain-containing protein [Anaerolineae bacterium CFX9]